VRRFARGRTVRRVAGQMNGMETRYSQVLDTRKNAGEILEWWYEGITFKLADDTRYTPDFVVQMPDGLLECHECKGFFEDHAKVKVKVAANKFPFVFRIVRSKAKKDGGGWDIQEIGGK